MAVVTRRYKFQGPNTANLSEFVAPSAVLLNSYVDVADVQYNNAVGGTTETLDEYMASLGFVQDSAAPAVPLSQLAAVATWGNSAISSGADTRWLDPGYNQNLAKTTDDTGWPCPRAGTLKNLIVRHNLAVGNLNSVVYLVFKNGVSTGITVTLATGAVGQASDLVNSVSVAVGDVIALQAVKVLSIGNGTLNIVATLEIQ